MKYIYLSYLTFFSFISFGQKYETIRYFNQNNELNSEIIYNIEEDKNNFFWMSSDNGILKYNGNSFKKFTIKNGLPSNDIFKIKIDSKNRVWLTGYYNGLYYIYNDKVIKVKNSNKYNTLEYLYENKDTVFFNNNYFDNITYVTKNNELKSLETNLKAKKIKVFQNAIEVFIINDNNFYLVDKKRKINIPKGYVYYPNLSSSYPTFIKDVKTPKYHSLNRVVVNDIIYYRNGKWTKLLKDSKEAKIKILNRDFENNHTFLYNLNKNIIVLKDNKYNNNLTKFYSNLPIDLEKIHFTFIDKSNNIWVITNDNQLIYIPENFQYISTYDNQTIFKNRISTIKHGLKIENKFFLITNDNSFGFFDKKDKKYTIIETYNNEIPYKILVNDKFLIVCSNNAFNYYNKNNYKLVKRQKIISNKNSKIIENKLIYSKGPSINTNDSVLFSIKNSIRFKDFLKINDTYYCSNENHIISKSIKENFYKERKIKFINVIEKYKDLVIAGTNSNGLYLLNKNLEIVNKDENYKNICDIKVVDNIVYVLTTNDFYVYKILKNKLILVNIKTSKDGILDSRNKNINIDNGDIYIFNQNGITFIDKNQLNISLKSEIDFECFEFTIKNNEIINLERENNTLNFLFKVCSFENENNFQKFIKIEGPNSSNNINWEKIENNNFTFKELNPGNYKLSLKLVAHNSKDKIKVIKFYIKPYFWETKIFAFIKFQIGIGLIILFLFFYKNRLKKRYLLKSKINDLELRALKSQMNPHFIFNTLNGLQSVVFTKNEIEINNYFVKFSRLLRTTLDILNSDKVNLYKEINYIRSYIELEQNRKINDFIYSIKIEKDIDLKSIEIPVMLLQPIVENAVEHGISKINIQGEIKIEIKKSNDFIMISIEDNGIGINSKDDLIKDSSYGCKIINERINILNTLKRNKFKIEWKNLNEENKRGTQVIIYIGIK